MPQHDRNRHLRLVADADEPATPPNRLAEIPDDAANGLIDALVKRLVESKAQCAAAEARAVEAESRARQDRKKAWLSDSSLFELRRANTERERQYPNARLSWIWLSTIWKLIRETYPDVNVPISRVAVTDWCARGLVKAEKIGSRWRLDIESFRAHWEVRGLPPLDWQQL